MEEVTWQSNAYKGSKHIQLQDVPTAKATGFNAAADDYVERGIDLNEELIGNKLATYFFRMNSDAMTGVGIYCGDVLIVDRSLPAVNRKIIIASFDGELIVRRLYKTSHCTSLLSENKNHPPITINDDSNYAVWGVVTYIIHIVS